MKVGEERAANIAEMRVADDGTVNLKVKRLLNTCKLLIVQAFRYSISTVSELVWEMSMTFNKFPCHNEVQLLELQRLTRLFIYQLRSFRRHL